MLQILNVLHAQHLAPIIASMNESKYGALNDRVRARLKERKQELGLSEADVAEFAGGWHKSKVAHKLAGRTDITLQELEALCQALKLSVSEVVRVRGLEFLAEMTPTQLHRHEKINSLPLNIIEALDTLLNVQKRDVERRGATPKRSLYGKPRPR